MRIKLMIMGLVLFLCACSVTQEPHITIEWKKPKTGLSTDTSLIYKGLIVGRVVRMANTGEGVAVQARLLSKYAHYVRSESTFVFHPASAEKRAYIEVRPMKMDSSPAADGSYFKGSENRLEAEARAFITDWRNTKLFVVVLVLIGLLVAVLLIKKILFLGLALGAGAVTAHYFSAGVDRYLQGILSSDLRIDLIAYALTFLAGMVLAGLVLRIVFFSVNPRK